METARRVPDSRWDAAPAAGAWSPAQIAEHLRLTYVVVGEQLAGGVGLRVRTPWWIRPLIRWRFLAGILQQGRIPAGARAPREIRPGDGPFPRASLLASLAQEARHTQEALASRWNDHGCVMTHHVFGDLTPPQAMRFAAVHLRHHAKQLGA